MDKTQEIMQKVRRIEMMARKKSTASFAGQFRSSLRGSGLDFDDFREYSAGDEPRFIDWKVTARTGTPYVRKFYEEREQVILIAIDASASMEYASANAPVSKLDYAAQIAAVLAYSAALNGDKVGLLLYGCTPHFYLPPAQGARQTLRMVREIISPPPAGADISLADLSSEILRTQRKSAMVFLMSDFLAKPDKEALGKLEFKHEIIPLRLADPAEKKLPRAGRVTLCDPESGELYHAHLDQDAVQSHYDQAINEHHREWTRSFTQLGIDFIDLETHQDFIPPLTRLFASRSRHFAH